MEGQAEERRVVTEVAVVEIGKHFEIFDAGTGERLGEDSNRAKLLRPYELCGVTIIEARHVAVILAPENRVICERSF